MASELNQQIKEAVKTAMRAKAKDRLGVLRMVTSEFKRVEVDERIEIDDTRVLAILDKMVKQRRDSASQYLEAGRNELAEVENFEISIIQEFLPSPLSASEIEAIVLKALEQTGATSMADMGKLMGVIKPQVQGRADMGEVSKVVKIKLNS